MNSDGPPREPEPSHGTDEEGDFLPADTEQDGAWVRDAPADPEP
jgi:hypothetical protein